MENQVRDLQEIATLDFFLERFPGFCAEGLVGDPMLMR